MSVFISDDWGRKGRLEKTSNNQVCVFKLDLITNIGPGLYKDVKGFLDEIDSCYYTYLTYTAFRWSQDGVNFSISTDDTTCFENSMTSEVQLSVNEIGLSIEQVKKCVSFINCFPFLNIIFNGIHCSKSTLPKRRLFPKMRKPGSSPVWKVPSMSS